LNEKFNKEIEILNNNNKIQVSTLEMKTSINQIKYSVEGITNRLDQAEERITGIEDKVEELVYSDRNNKNPNYSF
jgi:hypothetical protein